MSEATDELTAVVAEAPEYWRGDTASWLAWKQWLADHNLRNGGSQAQDSVWQQAWAAAEKHFRESLGDAIDAAWDVEEERRKSEWTGFHVSPEDAAYLDGMEHAEHIVRGDHA